jgi:hypothetical protein
MSLIFDRSGEQWRAYSNGAPTMLSAVDWQWARSECAEAIDRALARALDRTPDGADCAAVEAPYVALHRGLMRATPGAPWQGAHPADCERFELRQETLS